jgi:hypothetical protein
MPERELALNIFATTEKMVQVMNSRNFEPKLDEASSG